MEKDFLEWMYLKFLVGNFESSYQYYFSNMSFMAPAFRQGSVGILYSIGLAWAAFCFLKAPVDRLLTGISVLGMVFLAGFLVSPTTNTKNLGQASGTELSVGGYYSFVLAGSITQVFNDIVASNWQASVNGAGGRGGPSRDALAIAYNDKAEKFADKFLNGEGRAAVLDYHQQCGSEALKLAVSDEDKKMLKSVGIGANTLGMDADDASSVGQYALRKDNDNWDWQYFILDKFDFSGIAADVLVTSEVISFNNNRSKGIEYLKKLPPANSSIDGRKGYRIPNSDYYKNKFSQESASDASSEATFKKVSGSNADFQKMLPKGATQTEEGTQGDYVFYPSNCYDLYLLANETMKSLRDGTKDLPEFKNLNLTQSFVSLSTANEVRRGILDAMRADLEKRGMDVELDESQMEALGDALYDATTKLTNSFDKWMLEYKIPIMISSMAMIVAVLLLTFPVFAVISVIFGPKVLISYFKLMALPFIVVFINNLMLSLSANLISFNKGQQAVVDTFMPGGVDISTSMSAMSAETIIYAVITVAELAIAKFILWDDVRAITSFNPGSAGMEAAQRGAGMLMKAATMATGVYGKGARMATQAATKSSAKALNSTMSSISTQVSKIANSVSNNQNSRSNIGQGGGGSGGGGNTPSSSGATGGNSTGVASSPKGGAGGSNSLIPAKPPKEE